MPRKTKFFRTDQITSPNWVAGLHAGFDGSSQTWKTSSGETITDPAAGLSAFQADIRNFGGVARFKNNEMSAAAERLEHFIAGGFSPFTFEDASAPKQDVTMIPSNVRAMYNLADYFYRTEGDIAAALETPIMLAMRSLDVRCPDTGVKKEIDNMFDVDGLDMAEKLMAAWLSMATFGIAHPFEAYEGKDLKGIVLLPPMFTSVGSYQNGSGLAPIDGADRWTEETLKTLLPRYLYEALSKRNEENIPTSRMNIPAGTLYSLRSLDQAWVPYPKPLLQGAFRACSTRVLYEEMRRAVIEGFKHQLWLFLLGDMDHRPSPELMMKLVEDIDGISVERTGSLAWWGGLDVKVLVPETSDLLGQEEWWMLSVDIFRRLGINMRAATGNTTQNDRGQDYEIDIKVMLEKFEFMRGKLLHWLRGMLIRYGKKINSEAWVAAVRQSDTVFSANMMEISTSIKDRLLPMFTTGVLSPQSFLTQAGQNFETELANKKANKAAGEELLWSAPPTFTQQVGPGGSESSTSSNTQGRPKESGDTRPRPSKLRAAQSDDVEERRKKYLAIILLAYKLWQENQDTTAFIETLKQTNQEQLAWFADIGYQGAKGFGDQPPDLWRETTAKFINSFADSFGADMQAGAGRMDYGERTAMYANEGYRSALVTGIQAAMAERGATHWRRVLHPELSESGPCQLCIADAGIVHSIDEPFMSLHPNEVCSMTALNIRFSRSDGAETEFGIPGLTRNELSSILDEQGITHEVNVRRVRGK